MTDNVVSWFLLLCCSVGWHCFFARKGWQFGNLQMACASAPNQRKTQSTEWISGEAFQCFSIVTHYLSPAFVSFSKKLCKSVIIKGGKNQKAQEYFWAFAQFASNERGKPTSRENHPDIFLVSHTWWSQLLLFGVLWRMLQFPVFLAGSNKSDIKLQRTVSVFQEWVLEGTLIKNRKCPQEILDYKAGSLFTPPHAFVRRTKEKSTTQMWAFDYITKQHLSIRWEKSHNNTRLVCTCE